MSEELNKKLSRVDETNVILEEVLGLSFKVLGEIKHKRGVYFGQIPEVNEGVSGVPGTDNGFFNKTAKDLNTIKGFLLEISEIMDLF